MSPGVRSANLHFPSLRSASGKVRPLPGAYSKLRLKLDGIQVVTKRRVASIKGRHCFGVQLTLSQVGATLARMPTPYEVLL